MSQNQPISPMQARSSEPATSQAEPRSQLPRPSRRSELLSPKARPEDVFEILSGLIEAGQISKARQLTREAVRRFPDHDRIRLAKRILNDGKATPNPYVQPTADAEFEWLDNPPEEARGRWVALIGNQVVAMADSVDDLTAALKDKDLKQIPLVHHIPS